MKSSIKLYIFIAILIFSVVSKANYLNHPSYEEIAKILVEKYNGDIPKNYKELLALPGIGR